jgi:hypothetical protein
MADDAAVPEDAPTETGSACPRCTATLAPGAKFCEACGSSQTSPDRGGRRVPADVLAAGRLKSEANAALQAVRSMRRIFWAGAVLFGMTGIVFLFFVGDGRLAEHATLLAVLVSLQVGIFVCGAVFAERQPVAWSVVGACFMTLVAVMGLLQGTLPILAILFAIAMWTTLPKAIRLRAILQQYPDALRGHKPVIEPRRIRAAGAASRVGAPVAHRASRPGARRVTGRGRMALTVAGIVLLLALAGAGVAHLAGRKPDVRERTAAFVDSWNRGDFEAVASQFSPAHRDRQRASLLKIAAHRGWIPAPPAIGASTVVVAGEASVRVVFRLEEGGDLDSLWRLEDGSWVLAGLEFPRK